MTKKAPGKHYRRGMTLLDVASLFHDEETSRKWIAEQRWPVKATCPHCKSTNVQCWIKHPSQTHRCRDCPGRKMFSVKTGTVMENSNIPYRLWAIGIYLFTTNIKGISSMRLHRELGIGQKAAWFMLHRLRKAYETKVGPFSGTVEVDETYMGGKERNKHQSKKLNAGRGAVGKTAVVGIKNRGSNKVVAKSVEDVKKPTLQGFIKDNTKDWVEIFTDENRAYVGLENHASVKHSSGQYVVGNIHTNGVESFWSMLKRAHKGTYHKMSPKHLNRYVQEFAGRHNDRELNTIDQMASVINRMDGKWLPYEVLIKDNGLDSGAR